MAFTATAATSAEFDAALAAWLAADKSEGGTITVTAPINRSATSTVTSSYSPGSGTALRIESEPDAYIGSWVDITGWAVEDADENTFSVTLSGGPYYFGHLWCDDESRALQEAAYRDYSQVIPEQVRYVEWDNPDVLVPFDPFDGVANPARCRLQIVRAWCISWHVLTSVTADTGKWRCVLSNVNGEATAEFLAAASAFPLHGTTQACRVVGAPEYILEPGDWSYDRVTGKLILKAWPDITTVAQLEALGVCRPGPVSTLIRNNGCDDLDLRNLTVKRFGWTTPAQSGFVGWNGFGGYFTAPLGSLVFNRAPAAIELNEGDRNAVSGCEIAWGETGAVILGSRATGGCKTATVQNCAIHNVGFGVFGDHLASPVDSAPESQWPQDLSINSNFFFNVGMYLGGGSTWMAATRTVWVTHNHSVQSANSAFQWAQGGRFTPYWNQEAFFNNNISDDAMVMCVDHGAYYGGGVLTTENRFSLIPEGEEIRRHNVTNCASFGAFKRGWDLDLGETPTLYFDVGSSGYRVAGFVAEKDSRRNPGLAQELEDETAGAGAGVVLQENGGKWGEFKRVRHKGYDGPDDHIHRVSYAGQQDYNGTYRRRWLYPTLVGTGATGLWWDGGDKASERKAISSMVRSGGVVTVQFAATLTGQVDLMSVFIQGANEASFNGIQRGLTFVGTTATFSQAGADETATGSPTISPYYESFPSNWNFDAKEDVFADGIVPPPNTFPINNLVSLSVKTDVSETAKVSALTMGLLPESRIRWKHLLERADVARFYPTLPA